MSFATTDLCDDNTELLDSGALAVLPPVFHCYGQHMRFAGPAVTLKVFEDNALVRSALEQPGNGQVLVVDGGGSMRRALVGGQLGLLAQNNAWAGIVVYGCVRDTDELNACGTGIRALGAHPQRSAKQGVGETNVPVALAGVTVRPGDWIYADADGVLVSKNKLA